MSGSIQENKDPLVGVAYDRVVEEGEQRLGRTWPGLLATGTVGGIDISIGIYALLLVQHETGQPSLGSLAFGIGFIALILARSELFTENFLVPIAAVVAEKSTPQAVLRLWAGTGVMNIAGGWLMTGIALLATPKLDDTAVEVGSFIPSLGIGRTAFASALLAGALMTLMTWMEHGTTSTPARVIVAVAVAFVISAGQLNHAIVSGLEMVAALHVGAPFGYLDWLGALGWAALGNAVGGIGLVTVLRLIQIGPIVR